MSKTAEEVLAAVTEIASDVSGVPLNAISAKDTLKTTLGMTKPELVRFADAVTEFMEDEGGDEELPFEVVDSKNQTVGGVANEAFARLNG